MAWNWGGRTRKGRGPAFLANAATGNMPPWSNSGGRSRKGGGPRSWRTRLQEAVPSQNTAQAFGPDSRLLFRDRRGHRLPVLPSTRLLFTVYFSYGPLTNGHFAVQ